MHAEEGANIKDRCEDLGVADLRKSSMIGLVSRVSPRRNLSRRRQNFPLRDRFTAIVLDKANIASAHVLSNHRLPEPTMSSVELLGEKATAPQRRF